MLQYFEEKFFDSFKNNSNSRRISKNIRTITDEKLDRIEKLIQNNHPKGEYSDKVITDSLVVDIQNYYCDIRDFLKNKKDFSDADELEKICVKYKSRVYKLFDESKYVDRKGHDYVKEE